jgi:hypothetical protein
MNHDPKSNEIHRSIVVFTASTKSPSHTPCLLASCLVACWQHLVDATRLQKLSLRDAEKMAPSDLPKQEHNIAASIWMAIERRHQYFHDLRFCSNDLCIYLGSGWPIRFLYHNFRELSLLHLFQQMPWGWPCWRPRSHSLSRLASRNRVTPWLLHRELTGQTGSYYLFEQLSTTCMRCPGKTDVNYKDAFDYGFLRRGCSIRPRKGGASSDQSRTRKGPRWVYIYTYIYIYIHIYIDIYIYIYIYIYI